jgi:hypothetical protein
MINRLNHENLDYRDVISSIDLGDLTNFLVSLRTEEWVPSCYWNNSNITKPTHSGIVFWGIYCYLVKNNHIRIENPYWVEREGRGNHPNEYYEYTSYYNPLEDLLYHPILIRLQMGNHMTTTDGVFWAKTDKSFPLIKKHIKEHKIQHNEI